MKRFLPVLAVLCLWAEESVAQRRLFIDEVRNDYNGYVYDFIERYFGEISKISDSETLDLKLHDDKVIFLKGSVDVIQNLTDSTDFHMIRHGDSYYEATWKDKGSDLLSIAFPIQYELLLGKPKIEIEKEIDQVVGSYPCTPCAVDGHHKVKEERNGEILFRSSAAAFYQIPSLNDRVYYSQGKDGAFSLLCDPRYLEESVTNLFHPGSRKECKMVVEQNVYGFKVRRFNMSLCRWLRYCDANGLHIYAAIEEESADSYKVLVVAQCSDLGFNHLLSADVPKTFISDGEPVMNVKLNAYIPTHNVKDLYQQYKKSN